MRCSLILCEQEPVARDLGSYIVLVNLEIPGLGLLAIAEVLVNNRLVN